MNQSYDTSKKIRHLLAGIFTLSLGASLIWLILEATGMPLTPDLGYVMNSVGDTGSINVVTAILMDYRGFDTLGEASVIFTSVAVTAAILAEPVFTLERPILSIITRRAIAYLVPVFFMFPLYVITHGHLSPGGGFQGGVSLAVLVILTHVVFGHNLAMKKIPFSLLTMGEYWAALSFGILGLLGIFTGVGFLANLATGVPRGIPGQLLSGGLIPVLNLIVGIKVAAGLSSLYITLEGNPRRKK